MKKLLAFFLALCLMASVLPLAALADDPLPTDQVQVKVRTGPDKLTTLTIKENAPAYVAVKDDGSYGKWTEAEAPADTYVKMEFTQEPASLKVTFKNFNNFFFTEFEILITNVSNDCKTWRTWYSNKVHFGKVSTFTTKQISHICLTFGLSVTKGINSFFVFHKKN